jgi:acyl carrier protein
MQTSTPDEIRTFIVEEILWESTENELSADAPLLAGVLDSFGLTSLISFMEERYGITVPNEDLVEQNFGSVNAIAAYVERKQAEK